MEQKIRGVEHELALNTEPYLPNRSLVHLVGLAIEALRKSELVSPIRVEEPTLDYMAYNGFRVYNDMNHLELSSPSYNHPMEAVIYDKVAELFGYYALKELRRYFKGINIYKNNVSNQKVALGWRSNSYSTHSSILMDYKVCNLDVWDIVEKELLPFMIARVPVIGGGEYISCEQNGSLPRAGKYMYGDTLRYVISPRAAFIKRISSNDTVDARGILNQRDDPHADPTKYWRLHDINWEAARSLFQVYLRDCMEVLVMTAYEKGYLTNPPKVADPVSAIRQITLDTEECNWKLELVNSSTVDAIQEVMIGHYLAGIEKMLDNEEATNEDHYAFKLVEATLDAFDSRQLEFFVNGIDWITKKALIDEFADGDAEVGLALCNQFSALNEEVLEYIGKNPETCNQYSTFSFKDSLEFAKDAIPWEDWTALKNLVKHGLLNGPEGSREYIRCLVVREFQGLLSSIEWESINFYNARIRLDEPFIFNKEMCGDILEKSTNTFTEFSVAIDKLNLKKQHILYSPSQDHEKPDIEEEK